MNVNLSLKWLSAEKIRPTDGQEIIFVDSVGVFRGTFHTMRSGVVYVDGKEFDSVEWENVYQWIEYPEECEE